VRQAQGLFDHGGVQLNGAVCREPWKWLSVGDRIDVERDPDERYKQQPKARKYSGFELVFEDEHLLVVNKQAGVLTVPTDAGERHTLVHHVSDYLARGKQRRPQVWIVHRLDRGVSGLLVIAKRPEVATALREQWAERKPLRKYLAIVAGHLEQDAGTFQSYLTTDEALTRHSTDDEAAGELAITHYRTVAREQDVTLVEIQLETGRRNQIRVHFAEAGHPILGDQRYGKQRSRHAQWDSPWLALAAVELGFTHPVTEACHTFKIALPPAMKAFLARAAQ
jgi:23S rRNA pseudouridine1911/1915/1917 synthase